MFDIRIPKPSGGQYGRIGGQHHRNIQRRKKQIYFTERRDFYNDILKNYYDRKPYENDTKVAAEKDSAIT